MNLLKIARVPAPAVDPDASVLEAVEKMVEVGVGAVLVVADDKLKGIFTERDVVRRVAAKRLPLETTKLSEVMSAPVQFVRADTNPSEALSVMVANHFRHLPIVDEELRVQGILSCRHLLQRMVDDLSDELRALDAYVSADGIGG